MMAKRILSIILIISMVFTFAACGRTQDYDEEEEKQGKVARDEDEDRDLISGENITIGSRSDGTGKSPEGTDGGGQILVPRQGSDDGPGEKNEEGDGKGSGSGKKDDDQKPEDDGNKGEDEVDIPVEEGTPPPVEIDPNLDENEYVWTIKIDDAEEVPIPWPDHPELKMKVSLKLTCVKDGGKNCFGEYRCSGSWTVEYPDELLMQVLGGEVIELENKYTNQLEDFIMVMEKWDINKITIPPYVKEWDVDRGIGLALGEFTLSTSHQGHMASYDPGQGIQHQYYSAGSYRGDMSYEATVYDYGIVIFVVKTRGLVDTVVFDGDITRKRKMPGS